ncbi:hypothetical protein PHMEG_00031471 [Phytophthora megakarya]|uniref:Uncharacterized protein n=1 Tax=Phytophthora megakarya TaxID=4795 RepID=A0A225UY28_9STRA|nr:hypothetical protein PHMEG_00031471 [Phytophthora megakarya]
MQGESQQDWDSWVYFTVYSYNSGSLSTVLLSPIELMMGRRLRSPNELLRADRDTDEVLVDEEETVLGSTSWNTIYGL